METTAQIKNDLISRIKNSKDLDFLKALRTLVNSSEQPIYHLSEEQQKSIEIGRKEIREGKSFENKAVISEMKKWLAKK